MASLAADIPVNSLSIADLDGDGKGEILVNFGDVCMGVYDLEGGGLIRSYSSVYAGYSIAK